MQQGLEPAVQHSMVFQTHRQSLYFPSWQTWNLYFSYCQSTIHGRQVAIFSAAGAWSWTANLRPPICRVSKCWLAAKSPTFALVQSAYLFLYVQPDRQQKIARHGGTTFSHNQRHERTDNNQCNSQRVGLKVLGSLYVSCRFLKDILGVFVMIMKSNMIHIYSKRYQLIAFFFQLFK